MYGVRPPQGWGEPSFGDSPPRVWGGTVVPGGGGWTCVCAALILQGRLGFVLLLINPNDKVSLEHAAPLVPKIRGIFKHDLICVVNLQGLGPATGYVTDWEQVPVSEQEVLKAFEGSGEAPLVLSCSSSDAGSWEAMMVKAAQKLLKEKEGHKSPLLPHLMCCLM